MSTSETASTNVSSDSSSESSDTESDADSDTSNSDTSPTPTDPQFIEYLIKIARKHAKKAKDTETFTNFLALLPFGKASKRRSEETPGDLAKKFKKTTPSYLCFECDKPFADKENLKKHRETCNKEEPKKTPEVAKKPFPCDKCDRGYVSKGNLDRHIRNKHAVSARESYIDLTCRLCEDHIQFDSTDLLKKHYTVHHIIDAKSLSNIEHLLRAKKNTHLGETDPKKRADTKVNVSDKKKVIIKEKRQYKDNTRLIYKCIKCEKATESYDASVEHSQEHLVAKYTNTEVGYTRNFAFEADIDDKNVLKVVKYDFETLLTDAWFDMFDDAAEHKDRILSSSIYKHLRSVKLRSEDTDSSNGIPAYQCEMCRLFVHPEKIEIHCKNYKFCPEDKPDKFYCNICDVHFYSEPALTYHEENHAAGFKLVTFNNKNDVQINDVLGKLKNRPTDDSQEEEEKKGEETEKNPKNKADGKQIDIISVKEYCKESGEYVDALTFEAHSAAHQKEKEKYSGNVSENNVSTESVFVNNETATGEVTEELPHANQVDDGILTEDRIIPFNSNSKENDAENTDESDSNSDFCQSPKHSIHVVQVHTSMSVDENATDVESVGSPEQHLREIFGANDSQPSVSHNEELQSTQELQTILGNDDAENGNHEGRDNATEVSQDIFGDDMTQNPNKGLAEASMTNNEVGTNNEEAQDTVQVENEEGMINELIPDDDMELDRDHFLKLNAFISMKMFSRD